MDGNQLGLSYDNSPPSEGFFSQDTAERFVRLVVRDGSKLRGSHIGMPFLDRRDGLPEFGYWDNENEFDNNDCSEGKIAGGILGGGLATAISRGKDRWWAIPAGLVGGSMVGCQIDGG